MLGSSPFAETFGPKSTRKRPSLKAETYEVRSRPPAPFSRPARQAAAPGPRLPPPPPPARPLTLAPARVQSLLGEAEAVNEAHETKTTVGSYADAVKRKREDSEAGMMKANVDSLFLKGQSKRIWGELFKVLDSSDVVIQVRFAPAPTPYIIYALHTTPCTWPAQAAPPSSGRGLPPHPLACLGSLPNQALDDKLIVRTIRRFQRWRLK